MKMHHYLERRRVARRRGEPERATLAAEQLDEQRLFMALVVPAPPEPDFVDPDYFEALFTPQTPGEELELGRVRP